MLVNVHILDTQANAPHPHSEGLPATSDQDRDLSSGREAALGRGRLPTPRRDGPAPAHAPRHAGVHHPHASTPARPRPGWGSHTPDDHRRVLSEHRVRNVQQDPCLSGSACPTRDEFARKTTSACPRVSLDKNLQEFRFNLRRSTFNVRRSPPRFARDGRSARGMPSTFNLRRSTFNVRRSPPRQRRCTACFSIGRVCRIPPHSTGISL
jgi:hypothetical protein